MTDLRLLEAECFAKLKSSHRMRGLKVANARIRDAILNGVPASGPPSLKSNWARSRYVTPEGLNEAFAEAQKITQNETARLEKEAEAAQEPAKSKLLAKSQLYNPEVQYNHLTNNGNFEQPIFRYLAQRDWRKREMLLLMQRIEQLHMIPDTMPTLEPRARVSVQFETPTSRWLEPGEVVASTVSERLPRLRVEDFDHEGLYSVLIVNPDVPEVAEDTFSTRAHFAAVNVPLSFAQQECDFSAADVLQQYVPPHPHKNLAPERLCVWVFRQSQKISDLQAPADRFDIRDFAARHNLDPVGAHMWRSRWDRMVPLIREKHGLGEGTVFYRARTAEPENALLHVRHRKQWR